jgi:hypothetical protein
MAASSLWAEEEDGTVEPALGLAATALDYSVSDDGKALCFLGDMCLLTDNVFLGFKLTSATRAAFEQIKRCLDEEGSKERDRLRLKLAYEGVIAPTYLQG